MMAGEEQEDDSYIHQYYLGQKIDEVLHGDLKHAPPNFGFQSCHNRRISCSRLLPKSDSNQMKNKRMKLEEQKMPYYPANRETQHGAGKVGGGKSTSVMLAQNMMNRGAQEKSHGLEITAEEMNTPMFCALHESKNTNNSKSTYVKSVSHQAGVMFWLGYLYKKIAQSRCEQRVRILNDSASAQMGNVSGVQELRRFERSFAQ